MNPLSLFSLTCRLWRPAVIRARWLSFRLGAAAEAGPRRRSEKGQGLAEYALIFALVALVIIVVLALLGPQVRVMYEQIVCAVTLLGDYDPSQTYTIENGVCTGGGG